MGLPDFVARPPAGCTVAAGVVAVARCEAALPASSSAVTVQVYVVAGASPLSAATPVAGEPSRTVWGGAPAPDGSRTTVTRTASAAAAQRMSARPGPVVA